MEALLVARKQTGVRIWDELMEAIGHIAIDRKLGKKGVSPLVEQALLEWYDRQPEKAKYGEVVVPPPTKMGRPKKESDAEEKSASNQPSKSKPGPKTETKKQAKSKGA